MTLTGYLSGRRMARNTTKISRHNQCGGPKKAGLAPQSAWMRQGMGNLKFIRSCDGRAANTNCAKKINLHVLIHIMEHHYVKIHTMIHSLEKEYL